MASPTSSPRDSPTFIPSVLFISPCHRLPFNRHHRTNRPTTPRCNTTAPSPTTTRRAILFSSGQPILLQPAPPSPPPATPLYIRCPTCYSAYLANAVTRPLQVVCPKCDTSFTSDPASLLVPAVDPQDEDPSTSTTPAPTVPTSRTDRVTCPHFSACPGCTVSGPAVSPPILRTAASFLRNALRHPQAFSSVQIGPVAAWRTHAKLAVRTGPNGSPTLGLFRSGSHQLIPIPECAVHHPLINQTVVAVQDAFRDVQVSAYDEVTGKGDVRYVLMTVVKADNAVQVTFVWNATCWKDAQPGSLKLGAVLWKGKKKRLIHSVWFNWNAGAGNAILNAEANRFYHLYGPIELRARVMDVDFYFGPYAFRQANLDAFETLVLPKILKYIPVGSSMAEFCAGVGVIGLVALRKKRLNYLVASEINPMAENAFWRSYQTMREEGGLQGVAEYIVGSDVETSYMINEKIDVVMVDPPRAGLSPEFVQFLAHPKSPALRRIIYLSCGFPAFRNDARTLCNGEWKLRNAHAFVLFPGSDHIETLAIFDRNVKSPLKKFSPGTGAKGRDTTKGSHKSQHVERSRTRVGKRK
eukprot:GFKZ01007409.1.p1 GENE.GFKZ01007409.1~~GFKZ01007409.1.p1  ORF type:complete len:581 (+),score=50.54 GFKZ01007409.1:194-1936(+)